MKLLDIISEQKAPKLQRPSQFGEKPAKISTSKKMLSSPSRDGGNYAAVLVGGLTHGESLSEQISRLSSAIGKPVKGFSHSDSVSTIGAFIKDNPNIPIFLFSAGCRQSGKISKLPGVNLNKFYIIEPTYSGGETTTSVREAVSNGVPASHVFVGSSSSRGQGIVSGASDSRTNPKNCHYCSISSVGGIVGT